MAVALDALAGMEGVVLFLEFSPDGKCLAFEKDAPEMAAMAARYCATVTMEFNTLAAAFSTLSERPWVPQQGWMYRGRDYAVVIGNGGYRGVFVETAKANWMALFDALFESGDASS